MGHEQQMTPDFKESILEQMTFLAEQGLRVLAVARKFTPLEIVEHSDIDRAEVEKDLCLLGLAGLHDPPRLETKAAVQACTTAGITVSMLTGDHPFFADIWENQFLFWSVVIAFFSVFPAVYIPGLNTSVFKHKGISWEWAAALVCVFVFVSGMETWKYVKRAMGWFQQEETEGMKVRRRQRSALNLRQGFFTVARSFTKSKSEEKRTGAEQGEKEPPRGTVMPRLLEEV